MTLDEMCALLEKMPAEERQQVIETAREENAGFLWKPNPGPQTDAYFSPADLLYYGGSAGGGKSQLMIGLAVNEHRVSRLFRRQFKDIDVEGGLALAMAEVIGRSLKLEIPRYKGHNSQKHVWRIPSLLTCGIQRNVEFGAFETDKEASDYQGRAADLLAFDEAVQFLEHLIRFLLGWNRTTVEGQRCRAILGSNPPVTPEGLWIFEWFAPWLDPEHPNPAKPGELRWFAEVNGHTLEVDQDYEAVILDASGQELIIKPKSRTFIPASLSDNPDLLDTGYASQLAALPKHLREAMLEGKFTTTLEDAERQVIPTDWVLQAQQRWVLQKVKLKTTPMTALGADIADGGKDRMVCVPLHGVVFGEPVTKPGIEVSSTESKGAMILGIAKDDPQINIDCGGGYGGGVADMLESNNFNVRRCKGAFKSIAMDRDKVRGFANKRAEYIWRFREALDPERGDNIALPPGREILMELTSFREKAHSESRAIIAIEGNDEITKRIGRSPDLAWGFFFAWAEPDVIAREKRESHVSNRRGRGSPLVINRGRSSIIGKR